MRSAEFRLIAIFELALILVFCLCVGCATAPVLKPSQIVAPSAAPKMENIRAREVKLETEIRTRTEQTSKQITDQGNHAEAAVGTQNQWNYSMTPATQKNVIFIVMAFVGLMIVYLVWDDPPIQTKIMLTVIGIGLIVVAVLVLMGKL